MLRDYAASIIARNFRGCMIFGVIVIAATFTCAMCADMSNPLPRETLFQREEQPDAEIVIPVIGTVKVYKVKKLLKEIVKPLADLIETSNQLEQDENKARWPDAPERISHDY